MTNQHTNMKDERQSEYIKRVVDFAKVHAEGIH